MFGKLGETLETLAERWQDERGYEDISEYGKVIQQYLPEGFVLIKMNKQPFGFTFKIGTEAVYGMFCNAKSLGWRRIS